MSRTIFLTGATGFLGSNLMHHLLTTDIDKIIVLIRSNQMASGQERLKTLINTELFTDINPKEFEKLEAVDGDVTELGLGIGNSERRYLAREVSIIYHSAAICDFGVPIAKARLANVVATQNVLEFASECHRNGNLRSANHISTIAVCGRHKGIFKENMLELGQDFNNSYEKTKFEAELVVNEYRQLGLPVTIFRPSIVVGHSVTGYTTNFKMIYEPLHFLNLEIFDEIPANEDSLYNLVPVDYAAKAICAIANSSPPKNNTYHILGPDEISFKSFVKGASLFFGFRIPAITPLEHFDMKKLSKIQQEILKPYVPYFNYETIFDSKNTKDILKNMPIKCSPIDSNLLNRLFKFCLDSGYIKSRKSTNRMTQEAVNTLVND